jgi:hypothetical protein
MSIESTSEPPAPITPAARRRWRWRRWALLATVSAAVYAAFFYPRGVWRKVAPDKYLEVFGAQRMTKWESDQGRAQFLRLSFASHMAGFMDTATMWSESRLVRPLAESLAVRTGDTIIEVDHVRYPLSRMLPVRIDVRTYYHRERSGQWRPSTSLWH